MWHVVICQSLRKATFEVQQEKHFFSAYLALFFLYGGIWEMVFLVVLPCGWVEIWSYQFRLVSDEAC